LGATLLCFIHGATLENTLFKDNDDAYILRVFNPTQTFLYLKKNLLLTGCRVQANMLVSYHIIT
jgi:hypothetical protein